MTNEEAREYIIKHCCPFYPNVDKTEWEQAMGIAIKALEDNRWIPVEERLPEKEGEYLVSLVNETYTVSYFDGTQFWCVCEVDAWKDVGL